MVVKSWALGLGQSSVGGYAALLDGADLDSKRNSGEN